MGKRPLGEEEGELEGWEESERWSGRSLLGEAGRQNGGLGSGCEVERGEESVRWSVEWSGEGELVCGRR